MKPISESQQNLMDNLYARMMRVGQMTGWILGSFWLWDNGWELFLQEGRLPFSEGARVDDDTPLTEDDLPALKRPNALWLIKHHRRDELTGAEYTYGLKAVWQCGTQAVFSVDPQNAPLDLLPNLSHFATVDTILVHAVEGRSHERIKVTHDGDLYLLRSHEGCRYFKSRGQALFVAITEYGMDLDMFQPLELDYSEA